MLYCQRVLNIFLQCVVRIIVQLKNFIKQCIDHNIFLSEKNRT